ncbi:M23 family metallopeptidase [Thalassobacillus sp. CUG 92003]|uniref:M23 family metallopeptidase n=1 Tax=Thalassobacillus sp. CUG 92003 TaxID=2736641 RepID=UPI0015E6B2B9|nr:M23 family metallopeptidase [Thalassobacillus sp. CUG 92003]
MTREIEKIRKNISQRKRDKASSSPRSKVLPYHVQDEERYGYPPFDSSVAAPVKFDQSPMVKKFLLRFILAAFLFVSVAVTYRVEHELVAGPKVWLSQQLEEEFPFAKVTAWYEGRFGSPLELVDGNGETGSSSAAAMPVNGDVTESFQHHGEGILMTADSNEDVMAVESGTVIFAGHDEKLDKKIIIQHADGSNSIYGHLSSINVHLYENIKANTAIGKLAEQGDEASQLFFAIEKDKEYLDPIEVMEVDDQN